MDAVLTADPNIGNDNEFYRAPITYVSRLADVEIASLLKWLAKPSAMSAFEDMAELINLRLSERAPNIQRIFNDLP